MFQVSESTVLSHFPCSAAASSVFTRPMSVSVHTPLVFRVWDTHLNKVCVVLGGPHRVQRTSWGLDPTLCVSVGELLNYGLWGVTSDDHWAAKSAERKQTGRTDRGELSRHLFVPLSFLTWKEGIYVWALSAAAAAHRRLLRFTAQSGNGGVCLVLRK